jgi:hypothetical protein
LATILILIFAFNLVGEIKSGDCHETGGEVMHSIADSHIQSADPTKPDQDSHAGHPHLCHFGHCGHLALFSSLYMHQETFSLQNWNNPAQEPTFRYLAPPYKPPIA